MNDEVKNNVAEVENEEETAVSELEACRQEIRRLSAIIAETENNKKEAERFKKLFPNVKMTDIPDVVKQQAKDENIPITAAYALYARQMDLKKSEEIAALEAASAKSSGAPGSGVFEKVFSMDEIASMSRADVRKHYKAIMKSLK